MTDRAEKSRTERWCPVWWLACSASRKAARLTGEVRELREALDVVRADRDALASHLELAHRQRDRARALAAELGGRPRWNEADDVWLADNGVGPA